MKYWRQPRLGAICAFLYVLIFLGSAVYRTSQTALPDTSKQSTLRQNQTLLEFAHQHGGLFAVSAILSILGVAVLAGTAFGIYYYMIAHGKQRIGRITLLVGLAAILISCISAIVATVALGNAANEFAARHLISTVKHFQDQGTLFSILDVVGAEGLAIWLGLVAVTLIRIQGNRSMPGWSTLAACVLAGIGFPVVLVMVAWSTGTGIGLWRLSMYGGGFGAVNEPAPIDAAGSSSDEDIPISASPPPQAVMPAHPRRPAGKHPSAARHRRRH
ncbi:MAG: hypothetical protein ACRDG4_08065 [Chloroflexota bacterium]